MKKLIVAAVALMAIAANEVQAWGGGCNGPYCGGYHGPAGYSQPVFQAAPWYLYGPYNGHFQTAAPLTGAFYAPPSTGGMLVSPYYPAPQPPVGR
jgi:hypothetical protein